MFGDVSRDKTVINVDFVRVVNLEDRDCDGFTARTRDQNHVTAHQRPSESNNAVVRSSASAALPARSTRSSARFNRQRRYALIS